MYQLTISFMLLLLFTSPATSQQLSFVEQVDHAKGCVFRVETKDSIFLGTAFTVNKYGDLLTCFHVAEPNGRRFDSLYLRNFFSVSVTDGQNPVDIPIDARFTATIKARVPKYDLAILHVNILQSGLSSFSFLGLTSSTSLQEGQEVALCAFIPDDFTIPRAFVSRGIVSTIRRQIYLPDIENTIELIQLDLTAARGTSGGPVFLTNSGRVVAFQDAGIFDTEKATQTPYPIALTLSQICPVLDSLKIPYDMK